ncbi:type II secretion system protein GspC [Vibrio viridaestus]|uniref:type II secretion system protein GspC n=1 Tax=Vibrio viridaestus TaxID=2487322 RepID=UPI003132FB40
MSLSWFTFQKYWQSHQGQLSLVLFCFLLFLSVWKLGELVWFPVKTTDVQKWKPANTEVQAENIRVDLSSIKSANLFGIKSVNEKQPKEKQLNTNAPKTKLSLKLVGLVYAADRSSSLAIISNQGTQQTYGIDEPLDGSKAKLIAVLEDRVIINNQGREETLFLEENPPANGSDISGSHKEGLSSRDVSNSHVEPVESLEGVRDAVMTDPNQISRFLSFSEFREDGKVIGYKLNPGQSKVLFESTELEPGDVALEVNGIKLSDSERIPSVIEELFTTGSLDLLVFRNGKEQQINIQL